jgi:hypothetical protein
MHVTSALEISNDTVLATLFHTGTLISINRRTSQGTRVLANLQRPHGIHRRAGGFMLCDTLGHRVLLLNNALEVEHQIYWGTQWLQDAIGLSEGTYLAIENVHIHQLPASGLTNRLIEIDQDGRLLRGVDVGVESRLFTVREVDARLAHALALAWGRCGNFENWRWN